MKIERWPPQPPPGPPPFIPIVITLETAEEAIAVKALAAQVAAPAWFEVEMHRPKAEEAARQLNDLLYKAGVEVASNRA